MNVSITRKSQYITMLNVLESNGYSQYDNRKKSLSFFILLSIKRKHSDNQSSDSVLLKNKLKPLTRNLVPLKSKSRVETEERPRKSQSLSSEGGTRQSK